MAVAGRPCHSPSSFSVLHRIANSSRAILVSSAPTDARLHTWPEPSKFVSAPRVSRHHGYESSCRKLETLREARAGASSSCRGPIDVWSARKDEAHKAESEKGWELLQTADFPFQVAIPEGLPPSAKLEKNAGIAYELVTSLCVRSKKGLLKKETTSTVIQNTHPLWLDKHELHSTLPVYAMPEDHEAIQDDIRVKVMRNRTCYGPGDNVDVRVILTSDRVSPIKVKSISFSVRETITFKGGAKKTFSSSKAASQKSRH